MRNVRRCSLSASLFLSSLALLSASTATADDGQKTFVKQECNKCHSLESFEIEATVKSEKMRGPDLSTIGKEHNEEWIKQYVLKEAQLNDKNHRAKWEGSDKELQAIADWLASLE